MRILVHSLNPEPELKTDTSVNSDTTWQMYSTTAYSKVKYSINAGNRNLTFIEVLSNLSVSTIPWK